MGKNTEMRSLECELTSSEFVDRSKSLAQYSGVKEKLSNQKTEVAADFNARIKNADTNIAILYKTVSSGKEFRDVECEWEYDWKAGKKILLRQDIFREIDKKDIEEWERQEQMKFKEDDSK